jgi:hypothetical protein
MRSSIIRIDLKNCQNHSIPKVGAAIKQIARGCWIAESKHAIQLEDSMGMRTR